MAKWVRVAAFNRKPCGHYNYKVDFRKLVENHFYLSIPFSITNYPWIFKNIEWLGKCTCSKHVFLNWKKKTIYNFAYALWSYILKFHTYTFKKKTAKCQQLTQNCLIMDGVILFSASFQNFYRLYIYLRKHKKCPYGRTVPQPNGN